MDRYIAAPLEEIKPLAELGQLRLPEGFKLEGWSDSCGPLVSWKVEPSAI